MPKLEGPKWEELSYNLMSKSEMAFTQLIQISQDSLKRYASSYLQNPNEIEDVIQDVFLILWTRYIRSDKPINNLKCLLLAITRNCAIDRNRKIKTKSLSKCPSFHDTQQRTPRDQIKKKELNDSLKESINKLSIKKREILQLYYGKNLSINKISEILSISEEAVSSRLRRARQKLQQLLPSSFYQDWSHTDKNTEILTIR